MTAKWIARSVVVVVFYLSVVACSGDLGYFDCEDFGGVAYSVNAIPLDGAILDEVWHGYWNPDNHGNYEPRYVLFHWQHVALPTHVCETPNTQFQVVEEEDYFRILQGQDVTTGMTLVGPRPMWIYETNADWGQIFPESHGTRYWRVRGLNSGAPGQWSNWTHFAFGYTCTPESILHLLEPVSPSGAVVTGWPILFDWEEFDADCRLEGFRLQVAEDASFSTLVLDMRRESVHSYWEWHPRVGETLGCQKYFWRVAPISVSADVDGPFSQPAWFISNINGACYGPCSLADLGSPELVQPENGAHLGVSELSEGVVFRWEYPLGCLPDGYQLELSLDPSFGKGTVVITTPGPESETMQWLIGTPLEIPREYFWRVAPRLENGSLGPYSETHRFLTGDDCQQGSEVPPTLLFPPDGATLEEQPLFQWVPAEDGCLYPSSYCVVVSHEDDWRTTECVNGLSATVTELAGCYSYSWYVTAPHDPPQARSESRTFAVQCPIEGPSAEAPKDIACYRGPSTSWDVAGYLLVGERTGVRGRNMAGTWLKVNNLDNPGEPCWVPIDRVRLEADLDALRILNEPIMCASTLGESACEAAGGRWVKPAPSAGPTKPPYCQCP
jgi:hypothetical protein